MLKLNKRLCISRKVKKSESKSQPKLICVAQRSGCVYPVKLKNLKANHNILMSLLKFTLVVYIP